MTNSLSRKSRVNSRGSNVICHAVGQAIYYSQLSSADQNAAMVLTSIRAAGPGARADCLPRSTALAITAVADDVIKLVKDRRPQSRPPTIRSLLSPTRSLLLACTFLSCVAYAYTHENKIPAGGVISLAWPYPDD